LGRKRGIYVWVDEDVWSRFKQFVLAKHGKLHAALSSELTEAIKRYLAETGVTYTQDRASRLRRELESIRSEVLKLVEPGGSIPRRMLEDIVRRVSGVMDRRSVGARIEALIAEGFLQRNWHVSQRGDVFKVVGVGDLREEGGSIREDR